MRHNIKSILKDSRLSYQHFVRFFNRLDIVMLEHLVEVEQLAAVPAFLREIKERRFQFPIHDPHRLLDFGMASAAFPFR